MRTIKTYSKRAPFYNAFTVFHPKLSCVPTRIAGMVGMVFGTAALCFRKGSSRHALAGRVFVIAMLTMAVSVVYLAAVKHDMNNVGGGILTLYLLTTAWLTARRRDGETSNYDWVALLIPLVLGVGGWINGFEALHSGTGEKYGVPAGMHFFMGSVMLLAAAGDVRMLVRGGLFGTQRIVRHLWRMCFGLFIATGSFFLGQGNKVFPAFIRKTNVLFIPAILPLIADFLAIPSSLHKCVQDKVDAALRRCSLLTDLASSALHKERRLSQSLSPKCCWATQTAGKCLPVL